MLLIDLFQSVMHGDHNNDYNDADAVDREIWYRGFLGYALGDDAIEKMKARLSARRAARAEAQCPDCGGSIAEHQYHGFGGPDWKCVEPPPKFAKGGEE